MQVHIERSKKRYHLMEAEKCESAAKKIIERVLIDANEDGQHCLPDNLPNDLRIPATPFEGPESTALVSEVPSLPLGTPMQHFQTVGTFHRHSIFGIGEEMEDRAIYAKNHVKCLLIPRYWLLLKDQNMGNVWQRIKIYLDSVIPSRQRCFNNFLVERKWNKYKKQVLEEAYDAESRKNYTQWHDIPVLCRVSGGNV